MHSGLKSEKSAILGSHKLFASKAIKSRFLIKNFQTEQLLEFLLHYFLPSVQTVAFCDMYSKTTLTKKNLYFTITFLGG